MRGVHSWAAVTGEKNPVAGSACGAQVWAALESASGRGACPASGQLEGGRQRVTCKAPGQS